MVNRIVFAAIAVFWVTMNVLLWRSEFGHKEIQSAIPVEKVWEKVLAAPDSSSLEILHQGRKIGYCRWTPRSGEDTAAKVLSEDFMPGDTVAFPANYKIELEGSLTLKEITNNIRFELALTVTTNQDWEDFRLRVSIRPNSWEVYAVAAEEALHLSVTGGSSEWEETLKFSDLENPEKLVQEFAGPWGSALLKGMGAGLEQPLVQTNFVAKTSSGLKWEAHNDTMRFGHSRVRVYRVEAKLFGSYKIYVFVSRAGEILWVHLPGEIVLSNDAFSHF